MRQGFTLIELLVVMAIIITIGVVGMVNIVRFQKEVILDSAAHELLSQLRLMQTASQTGQVEAGESTADFEADGLPEYGLRLYADRYELIRRVKLTSEADFTIQVLKTFSLPSSLVLAPDGTELLFPRLERNIAGNSLTLTQLNGGSGRRLNLNPNGISYLENL